MEQDTFEASPMRDESLAGGDEPEVKTDVGQVDTSLPEEEFVIPDKAELAIDKIRLERKYSDEDHEKNGADKPKSVRELMRMRLEQIKNKYEGASERTKNILQMGAFAIAANVAPVIGIATGHNASNFGYAMAIEGLLGLAVGGAYVAKKVDKAISRSGPSGG
jgi:hypothetical protein